MLRFFVKYKFGHWSVIDRNNWKQIVGYSKKTDAESTADGLNKIKEEENILKMIKILQSLNGYNHFLKVN